MPQMPAGFVPDGFVPDAPPAQTAPDSALVRGATQLYEKSPLAAGVGLIKGAANVVAHPLDTYFGLAPVADTVKGLAKAQWDQAVQAAQKAKEAANGGGALSASEAFGHGLAAILPILGPAAADVGEHGARGDIAGMAGGALGLLTPFAVKYGLELKSAPDAVKADVLRREATKQVSEQVLAPGNPRYKPDAARIAPQVLARGLKGGRIDLQQIAEDGMEKAGSEIDAAVQSNNAPVPTQPILDTLNDRIDAFKVKGQVIPTAAGRVKALEGLRDYIAKLGANASFDEIKRVRDDFYDTAAKAKGYAQAGGNEAIVDTGWAAREAGSAIRQALAADRPELSAPNADYTFFKRLNDVLDPNLGRPKATNFVPSGVTGGMSTAGAIIGQTLSDVPGLKTAGAIIGSQLLPKIKAITASPAWQLAAASKKMALADALEAGQFGKAQNIMSQIANLAPRGMAATAVPAMGATPDSTQQPGR